MNYKKILPRVALKVEIAKKHTFEIGKIKVKIAKLKYLQRKFSIFIILFHQEIFVISFNVCDH